MKTRRLAAWEQLNQEIITCTRCPRLVDWREGVAREKRAAYRDCTYWGRPVPGFGDRDPRLFIIGLAPGAHGANRTGRMFTGDSSGDTLAAALHRVGLANQPFSRSRDDGLRLPGVFLTAVARCVPPGNKPTAEELANCRPFLARELDLCPSVQVVLTLGRVAFDGYIRVLRERGVDVPSLTPRHGECYTLSPGLPVLAFSYHPSRQNTQTGRLTTAMLDSLFERVKWAIST
jgi:uracil-DNA glycosylase family 4